MNILHFHTESSGSRTNNLHLWSSDHMNAALFFLCCFQHGNSKAEVQKDILDTVNISKQSTLHYLTNLVWNYRPCYLGMCTAWVCALTGSIRLQVPGPAAASRLDGAGLSGVNSTAGLHICPVVARCGDLQDWDGGALEQLPGRRQQLGEALLTHAQAGLQGAAHNHQKALGPQRTEVI